MRRFFVEEILEKDGSCFIRGSEARHISKVLRKGPGDRIIITDRKARHFLAKIQSSSSKEVRVALEKALPKPPPPPVKIMLCQALIKAGHMDYVIQKASELGVDRVLPFTSERTVVRFEDDRLPNKMRHWREIAMSSAKQCGRITPLKLAPPCTLRELMMELKQAEGLKVILWEEEGARGLKGVLRESSPAGAFIGVVGPEGGFTLQEIVYARDMGLIPASLGNRILRSETAASTIVAIVQYEWGDLGLF